MPRVLSGFPTKTNGELYIDAEGKRPGCVFCDTSAEKGFMIVHEDAELIAFNDRSPGAETHLLIIPKKHVVSTVRDLTADHVGLVNSMIHLGRQLASPACAQMGFHIPPFSSVHHLHLHVLAGKRTRLGKLKYPIAPREGGKGWSWFVSADQAIRILQKDGKIGVYPG